MKKHFKLLFAVICLLLCTSVLISTCLVMLHNSDHDCLGDNCPICQAISSQMELFRSVLICCVCGVTALLSLQPALFVSLIAGVRKRKSNLVACKVKLSA